jgi:hypothetical protein
LKATKLLGTKKKYTGLPGWGHPWQMKLIKKAMMRGRFAIMPTFC